MFITNPGDVKLKHEYHKRGIALALHRAHKHQQTRNSIVQPVTGLPSVLLHIINIFLEPHILCWNPALLRINIRYIEYISYDTGLIICGGGHPAITIIDNQPPFDKQGRRQVSIVQYNKVVGDDRIQYADNTAYEYCAYCTQMKNNEVWHRHQGYCDICGTCQACRCGFNEH